MSEEEKTKEFIIDCIDKMGEVIEDSSLNYQTAMYNSTKAKTGVPVEPWYTFYTWDENEEFRFKKWFTAEYCRRFRRNKKKGPLSAEKAFGDFNLRWGLKRNDLYLDFEEE